MSLLEILQNSRFGKPFRKRQKLGEDEDDWCDAMNNLDMDSSSSDEYVDAYEQIPLNSSPQPQGSKERSKGTGYDFNPPREGCSNFRFTFGSTSIMSIPRHEKGYTGEGGLFNTKLNRLADNRRLDTAPIPLKRKVTVTLMTSSRLDTINGLKKKLETLKKLRPDLIDDVKVLQLPYSRIQYYEFTEDVDVMILCHSIENRGFTITNVTDSLYDDFLNYCHGKLGKEKIVVVAHDFPHEAKEVRDVKRASFKHTQWTTFEKAGLVMICGMMDNMPKMREEDWQSLERFLEAASKSTPIKDETTAKLADQKTNPRETGKQKPSNPETTRGRFPKAIRSQKLTPRKPTPRKRVIYLCTSWGLQSVVGFKEMLQTLLNRSYTECEVRETELSFSCPQDFRFPAEVGKPDAMILCHSMQNRGFVITDVEGSIYDDYLTHCNKVFGRENVAVVVHEFECADEILKVHMDTFQRNQPKTFQLAGLVTLAKKLDVSDVQLGLEDSTKLENFVKKLRSKIY